MKRVIVFTMIMLLGAVFLFVPVSANEKQVNNFVPPFDIIESEKFYFGDYNTYSGPSDYYFDFSFIDQKYDFFVFNFEYYTPVILDAFSVIEIKSGDGIRIVPREYLEWTVYFDFNFELGETYFVAYNYNFLINLNDNLTTTYSRGYGDGMEIGYDDGYDDGIGYGSQLGYDIGYDDGYDDGYFMGHNDGTNETWIPAYNVGYDDGYDIGYDDGFNDSENFNFTGLLAQVFVGLGSLLAIELLPGISIGAIIAVPIVFGIIAFIIGKRGGKDD